MEKLKKLKAEHNHLFTDLLKASIFGLVMLAPLIAVASKCLYVTCNKNAKDSYSGSEEFTYYEKVETLMPSNNPLTSGFIEGNYYKFTSDASVFYTLSQDYFAFKYIEGEFYFNVGDEYSEESLNGIGYIEIDFNSVWSIGYYDYQSNCVLSYDSLQSVNFINVIVKSLNTVSDLQSVNEFIYADNTHTNFQVSLLETTYYETSYVERTIEQSTLDNAFYIAVDELGEKPLFSWTKNTAMYTTINTMTSGLDINGGNNTLAILLTYWALITIVYVIFDIVIQVFVKITHFLQD